MFQVAALVMLSTAGASVAEVRVVEYLKANVEPGKPVVVSRLVNQVFTSPEERKVLDRLFGTFFKIPLYVAQHQQAAGRPPTLDELSEQFRFHVPGEADVLLRILESDPRVPRFMERDPDTGEITRVDVAAITAHPKFGKDLERSLGGWVGRAAPAFSLSTQQGEIVSSKSLAGRPYLLYFWFSGCPPCMQTTPLLVTLHRQHAEAGLTVVGANADDVLEIGVSNEEREAYAHKVGMGFPLVRLTPEVHEAFGSVSIFPTIFVVDRAGNIVRQLVNAPGAEALEEAASAVLE